MPSPGLSARVTRARRSIERLKKVAEVPWEEYSRNEDLKTLTERHLHIVLECILELASFIASRMGLARSPTYRSIVRALIDAKVIPPELERVALAVPGMRNVLVHGYAEVEARHRL